MSDFEIFSGFDTADQMDEQAFERFKEQMKRNAAAMQSSQQQEQRQKQKEDKLAKILLKFVKSNKKMHLIVLISRALEQNIPAFFILSIVLLGNEDIQDEVGVKLALPAAEVEQMQKQETKEKLILETSSDEESKALLNFDPHKSVLPLKLKIAIDLWARNIFEAGSISPHKVLGKVYNDEKNIKDVILQLSATVIEDYMRMHDISGEYLVYKQFSEFLLKGIFKRLEEQVKE